MNLELRDQQNQGDYRAERAEQEPRFRTQVDARAMSEAVMASGESLMSTIQTSSSAEGSSRAANWLSSSEGGMKCPLRSRMRCPISDRSPRRKTNCTRPAWARIISRYDRFNAEQETTTPFPFSLARLIVSPIACSHPSRS